MAVYESSALLLAVQILLSVFKILWGRWALPKILTRLTRGREKSKIQVFTQIIVNILNHIVIPCLVVAVVSPNCFYNALVAAPEVTSTVYYTECTVIDGATGQCLLKVDEPLPTSYSPPFTYNYQCSSSLITYYSPAFVSMCIVSTFVTPLAQYLCQWLYKRATSGTYWYKLLDSSLPNIVKPLRDCSNQCTDRSFVNSSGLVTSLVSTLGLILTFGVMFPPLCVAFTGSMWVAVLIFRINVSRFVYSSTGNHFNEKLLEVIRVECNSIDSMRVLKGCVWVLITVSCWFYTLFLFDTLGDAVGFEGAYWVLIVMPLMPLMLYIVYGIGCRYCMTTHASAVDFDSFAMQQVGVEMQTIEAAGVHNVLVVNSIDEAGGGEKNA